MNDVFSALDSLRIRYELHDHPPVFTVEQAAQYWAGIEAAHCKNLFLRNQKGTRHYLVVLDHRKQADLKRLARKIGDDRLSFASPERLLKHLGLTPGAVSPMGLIHPGSRDVIVVLDVDLLASERIGFHPNVNTATITVTTADFLRFLESRGNVVRRLDL